MGCGLGEVISRYIITHIERSRCIAISAVALHAFGRGEPVAVRFYMSCTLGSSGEASSFEQRAESNRCVLSFA